MLKHFKSTSDEWFKEAMTLLDYGLKFRQAGYMIDFEQPVLNGRGNRKKPDLMIRDTQTEDVYYCEITRLVEDPLTNLYDSVISHIVHGGFKYGRWLKFAGMLHQRLQEQAFKELLIKIDQLVRQAADGYLHELVIGGLIELAVADYHDPALETWAKEHGIDINCWGFPAGDPYIRIKRKIYNKADQAAVDHYTILVIKLEDGTFHYPSPEKLIHEIEDTLQGCEDVAAVWLTFHEFGGLEKVVQSIGMHYQVTRTERYALGSQSLLIFNRHCKKGPLTETQWQRLFKHFL